jgi:hypothetical protein
VEGLGWEDREEEAPMGSADVAGSTLRSLQKDSLPPHPHPVVALESLSQLQGGYCHLHFTDEETEAGEDRQ